MQQLEIIEFRNGTTALVQPNAIANFRGKYVALDRDDTLIKDAGKSDLRNAPIWLPGVVSGLRKLDSNNVNLVIFTNQSGLASGLFSLEDFISFHEKLNEMLEREIGSRFIGIFFCKHTKQDECLCRKPKAGMFEAATFFFGLAPLLMIGNSPSDTLAAKNANVESLEVIPGNFEFEIENWVRNI
jgi:D-glycero-D-manno-heptose 1,7-bisphosphate phosphatase